MAPLAEALRAAAELVARVAAGRSLSAAPQRAAEGGEAGVPAAVTDLCYGTLRSYGRAQALVRALAHRKNVEPIVEALLWCALYALGSQRYAPYTVVDQAVRACVLLNRPRAKDYVNALLRAYLRRSDSLARQLAENPVAHWQHPQWWIGRVQRDHPDAWQQILEAGNSQAPMCLRVNRRRTTAAAYCERLAAAGIGAELIGEAAVRLGHPMPSAKLPGFAEGEVSVQDAAAQRTAALLEMRAGQRVLDACAAPGGKTAHLLETEAITLTALELDPARAATVTRNLARLGLVAQVRAADCTAPEPWWDGTPFDRVLADVPCTASGVVRRHPDVKWLRRDADVAANAARQARLLAALWRVLAPNGKLLYVTCSVFREENDAVVEAFAASTPTARLLRLSDGGPRQVLPSAEHDGFYFALLAKIA